MWNKTHLYIQSNPQDVCVCTIIPLKSQRIREGTFFGEKKLFFSFLRPQKHTFTTKIEPKWIHRKIQRKREIEGERHTEMVYWEGKYTKK